MQTADASSKFFQVREFELRDRVMDESCMANDSLASAVSKRRWEEIVDSYLIEWGSNPSEFEDEDLRAPTPLAIATACKISYQLRDGEFPPPTRVVADGDGGVAIEKREGMSLISIEVDAGGQVEVLRYQDSRLIGRVMLAE